VLLAEGDTHGQRVWIARGIDELRTVRPGEVSN
jgi:hypothetical protein